MISTPVRVALSRDRLVGSYSNLDRCGRRAELRSSPEMVVPPPPPPPAPDSAADSDSILVDRCAREVTADETRPAAATATVFRDYQRPGSPTATGPVKRSQNVHRRVSPATTLASIDFHCLPPPSGLPATASFCSDAER